MRCIRCNGLKVSEIMRDGGMTVLAYRCIHCGDIVDPKIILHRQHRYDPRPRRSRTPIFNDNRWKRPRSVVG